jgi:hypothetical protein
LAKDRETAAAAERRSLEQALQATRKQLDNLTTLRIRELLTDEEFLRQRETLEREELKLIQQQEAGTEADWFEPLDLVLSFNKSAVSRFETRDPRKQRAIIAITGSNLVLKDRELTIDARKPFRRWPKKPTVSQMCGFLDDVRTFASGPDGDHLLFTLRDLATSRNPSKLISSRRGSS